MSNTQTAYCKFPDHSIIKVVVEQIQGESSLISWVTDLGAPRQMWVNSTWLFSK